jgi:hypothetical protein
MEQTPFCGTLKQLSLVAIQRQFAILLTLDHVFQEFCFFICEFLVSKLQVSFQQLHTNFHLKDLKQRPKCSCQPAALINTQILMPCYFCARSLFECRSLWSCSKNITTIPKRNHRRCAGAPEEITCKEVVPRRLRLHGNKFG